MNQQEEQFTRGFNNGYLLAKYLPKLKAKIDKNLKDVNDFSKGFQLGAKEFDLEKLKQLKEIRKGKSKSRYIGRER